ncbi:helix-turn-helix transcriptional regulator [Sutcliffiella horikoshii]|uniref:Helix-turn-helix transcriptional regulator n=1 Tax=Sutcliffiella horikoshii TaxID=79883 RepID=A0A5D4T0R5_9BACI|nr:helix-turn-helix transcriptional regulator [Sutcliffiella horikoshii]TYS68829.1 helix-turn-helix transcriptional regulator [Sutcliffiella horikoshii]
MVNTYEVRSNLKQLIEERGISANKLAAELNERRSTLNDLIANNNMNNRHIPARLIAKLCIFFDVSPSVLFSIVEVNEETGEEVIVIAKINDTNK